MDVMKGHCWRCEQVIPERVVECAGCSLGKYCSQQCRKKDKVRHQSVECQVFGRKKCSQCRKVGQLSECAGCNNAWYCNSACQKANWGIHKKECNLVKAYIKEAVQRLGFLHCLQGDRVPLQAEPPVYVGNIIAQDFLCLENNEWSGSGPEDEGDLRRDYHVLSVGCGDLRNTLLTVASLPERHQGKLHVTLDDFDPFVMARNAMFLAMMARHASKEGIASSLATIWYSVHISAGDYDLIQTTLRELVEMSQDELCQATNGLVRVQEADLGYLREVWQGWLALECRRKSGNSIDLRQQRCATFDQDLEAQIGLPQYMKRLPPKDARFMKEWFTHGLFLPDEKKPHSLPYDNPTLTGRRSLLNEFNVDIHVCQQELKTPKDYPFVYCVRTDQTPFMVWDCLRVDEFTRQSGLSAMVWYHAYVTHILQRATAFISQGRLTVDLVLANCLDFPNHHLTLRMPKYDRIFTSNLSDFIGLGKLLTMFKPMLDRRNKHATIVMGTLNWMSSHTPQADVQRIFPSQIYRDMCRADTGFSERLSMDINNHREYYNNTHWFLAYLRADLMAKGVGVPRMDHVPQLGEAMRYNGMQMRNFRKGLNKLVPFQYRVNARGLTMVNGHERNTEWCLSEVSD